MSLRSEQIVPRANRSTKTEKVAAVITIPENFEENLLAGKHTSVALTANGAFPVKSRAVMAGSWVLSEKQRPLAWL